jgi:hypothetical protein
MSVKLTTWVGDNIKSKTQIVHGKNIVASTQSSYKKLTPCNIEIEKWEAWRQKRFDTDRIPCVTTYILQDWDQRLDKNENKSTNNVNVAACDQFQWNLHTLISRWEVRGDIFVKSYTKPMKLNMERTCFNIKKRGDLSSEKTISTTQTDAPVL